MKFLPTPNPLCPCGWLFSYRLGCCSVNCTKAKFVASSTFRTIWTRQKKFTHRKLDNYCATLNSWDDNWPVQFQGAGLLSIPWRASQFSRCARHNRLPRVQLGLAEISGICNCLRFQFPWCTLALALDFRKCTFIFRFVVVVHNYIEIFYGSLGVILLAKLAPELESF